MKNFILIITNKCNLNCIGCLREKNKKDLSMNFIKKLIPQLKELNYDTISLTGGEVSQHPEFEKIIELIVNKRLHFGLVTNGLDYKKYLELYKKYPPNFKYITFSLDGSDKLIHEKIRGKNTYKPVIEAIKEFDKARKKKVNKINININSCLNKINYGQIKQLVSLARRLNVDEIRFLAMLPTGQNENIILNKDEKDICLKEIINIKQSGNLKIKYLTSLHGKHIVKFCNGFDLKYLSATPEGNLIFCCDIVGEGGVIGSLKEEPLIRLIQKATKISNDLITLRSYMIHRGVHFEGMNTCIFCNNLLLKKKKV